MILAIFSIVILIGSVIIHEVAHGYAALALGDPTAKLQGRLTLNPNYRLPKVIRIKLASGQMVPRVMRCYGDGPASKVRVEDALAGVGIVC